MITKIFNSKGNESVVEVTFLIPNQIWADAIHLVGDFNDWNHTSHPFQRSDDGHWIATLCLDVNKVYQFRYLCNGGEWMNDSAADGFVANRLGGENCLLITQRDFTPHREG